MSCVQWNLEKKIFYTQGYSDCAASDSLFLKAVDRRLLCKKRVKQEINLNQNNSKTIDFPVECSNSFPSKSDNT